jgi:glycogen operon protein
MDRKLDSSPLHVEVTDQMDRGVIKFTGRLSSTLDTSDRDRLVALAVKGLQIDIDFSGVTEVSAYGLRGLLRFVRFAVDHGCRIKPHGVSEDLYNLVDAAGFSQLLTLNATVPNHHLAPISPLDIDAYPTHWHGNYGLRVGLPQPHGASVLGGGINFAVFSRHANACSLVLFHDGDPEPFAEIAYPPEFRIGDVYAMVVYGLPLDQLEYGFRVAGPFEPRQGHRFDDQHVLLDPAARSVSGRGVWGTAPSDKQRAPYRSQLIADDFDWEGDRQLDLPLGDLVIYEMHVRGFTRSPTAHARNPGTFAGIREKIPYLKSLGINCVELLPIFEFDECDNPRTNPLTGERLYNYWGYNTLAFYAPNSSYAATGSAGLQADELKALVKELHRHGIEVILDVVFNHTAEGNEQGPTISFRGLDNKTYYMLTPDGSYYNFSGCGNTFNCNHPVVRAFVIDCLRHWVIEYHIDGFRFDLASILGRAPNGTPLDNPPLLEALAADPVLGRTKLIAEAWDAGGLYQVGSFPSYGRWAEWNGRYRDCLRKFLKGDFGQVSEVANRILGSPDLYQGRGPTASINFITCHDGFTLADLVSYNDKHNESNGEQNRDGGNDNHSWNCGVEGPTDDPAVNQLRLRQMKNALAMMFVSQGVPMLPMGDEVGRTQQGNNNTYCHDSELNWLDWRLVDRHSELLQFCQRLIHRRHATPIWKSPKHPGPGGEDVIWHGTRILAPDWSATSRVLAFQRVDASGQTLVSDYVAFNMHWDELEFEIPSPPRGQHWYVAVDTSAASPADAPQCGMEAECPAGPRKIAGRSVLALVAR